MIDHDVAPGPLTRCQISGSENLQLVIDLGHQPPCDSLLSHLAQPETSYPLSLYHCPDSGLAQLGYNLPGDQVYSPTYPYRSGISKPLEEYQRAFAERILARWGSGFGMPPFVVDVGSNDGTLLSGFKARGCRVLGIEPTNIARIAQQDGIETIEQFFTETLARNVRADGGAADFITMTNVFAHMTDLGEIMRGILALLGREGIFITESHYLLDVLEKNQFDTIYHEHVRTYSLKSLVCLFAQYGMEVFDVERGDRYGGNIRVYVARQGMQKIWPSVADLLALEDEKMLHTPEAWETFRRRVEQCRDDLMAFLYMKKREGAKIVGCSAPGRASTLINYYGITNDLVPYTGELHNSLKLGKYLPGSHIKVEPNTRFKADDPDYIILFAWHYGEVIAKRLRAEGITSRLVVPLPEFSVLE